MSDFDPAAYLKERAQAKPFDPAAYLKEMALQGSPETGFHSATAPVQSKPRAINSVGSSMAHGAGQGFTLGFGDEINGAIQALGEKYLPESLGGGGQQAANKDLSNLYRGNRDSLRKEDQRAEEDHRGAYLAGNALAGVTTAPLMPGGAGGGLLKLMGTGAALGGLSGAGASSADLTKDGNALDFGRDVALSAVAGAALPGLLKAAGGAPGLLRSLPKKLSDFAELRAFKAAGPMLRDYRAVGEEGAKRIGRRLLDNNVLEFGSNVESVADKLGGLRANASKEVGNSIAALDASAQPSIAPAAVADNIEKSVIAPLRKYPAQRILVKDLENEAEQIRAMNGPLSYADAEGLKRSYSPSAKFTIATPNETRDAYRGLYGSIQKQVESEAQNQSPAAAQRFIAAKQAFKDLAPTADLASDQALRQQANRFLAPSDQGVGIAMGLLHGNPVTGLASAALHNQLRTRGASAAAVTANGLAKALSRFEGIPSAPAQLDPILEALMRRAGLGGSALVGQQTAKLLGP